MSERGPLAGLANARTRHYVPAGSGRDSSMVRRHVWVAGRVQGVWFRQSCAEEARLHNVSGWVRNRNDGRVEAVFEGDLAGVAALVDWCRHGSPGAEVIDLEVTEEEPEGFTGFSVGGWN